MIVALEEKDRVLARREIQFEERRGQDMRRLIVCMTDCVNIAYDGPAAQVDAALACHRAASRG